MEVSVRISRNQLSLWLKLEPVVKWGRWAWGGEKEKKPRGNHEETVKCISLLLNLPPQHNSGHYKRNGTERN